MRTQWLCLLLLCSTLSLGGTSVAQQAPTDDAQLTASCTLEDGKDVSVRYNPVTKTQPLPQGKVWEPGGGPLLLFTEAPLMLHGTAIPAGAYTLYLIPGKQWTLIVSRNTTVGSIYDERMNLVRAPMETAQLSAPVDGLQVSLGHLAAKQCGIRVYYGKVGSWVELNER
jgi:hypothetical protein